ncbi:DUF3037 domain-containing protein [Enterococcus malodoratus]|uniref:DUF3037 domain-containing protein n=1 Tax=Enterococcus malodoratus ATCC 43197 TaxID=1158601 RepID=R2PC55_9ENTE|nr:DUF3037 domain-containing protein [Enterococcus malodoratus]EOH80763.1 hypothetical protein UAI_00803 [Enterococcus malodoratus ATCC 43197]EOT69272.1 hypothetical protein I585_00734 [Enterococcus malodoratus ATCC 43197]OJG63281.1 hypothetical protein RV07_GL001025 [Enterococcus malodoratus]SPW68417.1 Protein of uncharacterised function (DUF3037) [Enterococcus malodoratus]STC71374.1 Protein of uncharacterised function (DUF3037) [Enterococcus malodoratus]
MSIKKKISLYYAVLQYMPDPIRRESINVGIVFHVPELNWSKFESIKNRQRIKSFDDEYDPDYISLMFESFGFEFNSDQLDSYGERFSNINSPTFLEENIRFYVNEFRFLPVEMIESTFQSYLKDIENLRNTFLYYDKPKGERITTSEVKSLMKRQLKFYNFNFKQNKREFYDDFIEDNIFDLANENFAIKALSFDKSRNKNLANELKILMYDLYSNKSDLKDYKILIVVDNSFDVLDLNSSTNRIYQKFKVKLSKEFPNASICSLSKFAENITYQKL